MPRDERAQPTSVGWGFRGDTSCGGAGGIASKLPTCTPLPQTNLNVCRLRDCLGQPLKESTGERPTSGTFGQLASWSSSKMTRESAHPRWRPSEHDPRVGTTGPKRREPRRCRRSTKGAESKEAANPGVRFQKESQERGPHRKSSLPGARGPWTRCRRGVGLTANNQQPQMLPRRVPWTSTRNRTWRWVQRDSMTSVEGRKTQDSLEAVDGSKDDPEVSQHGGHGPEPQRVSEPGTWHRWPDVQPAAPVNDECPGERAVERLIRSERGQGWLDEISTGLRLSGGLRDLLHRRIRFLFIQGGRVARDLGMVDVDEQLIAALVVRALWGPARVSRTKEIVFTVLSKGHRVSPIMHTRYERLLWLACLARRPGVTQVFAQAIWESGGRPPGTGPVGRALRKAASLGWTPREGWWCWDVPGQEQPMHFVQEPLRQLQHRVRDSLRCHSSRQLEARRPVNFGGLGDGADGPACRAVLRAASTELEKSLLRGLQAGAVWTAARVSGHGTRANAVCPHCGAAHEDVAHVLWDCPEWGDARGTWLPWLTDAAGAIPSLGPPDRWPSCLRKAGLFPLRLAQGVDRDLLDEFLYRLAAGMAASWGISRATATPFSRSSRVRGPATLTHGTPSLAPYRGTQSATSRGCSRGCQRTGGGPRISSTTWSGGPGR